MLFIAINCLKVPSFRDIPWANLQKQFVTTRRRCCGVVAPVGGFQLLLKSQHQNILLAVVFTNSLRRDEKPRHGFCRFWGFELLSGVLLAWIYQFDFFKLTFVWKRYCTNILVNYRVFVSWTCSYAEHFEKKPSTETKKTQVSLRHGLQSIFDCLVSKASIDI